MKGEVDISCLNTIREVQLCNALGFDVIVDDIHIHKESELFLEYFNLREKLASCVDEYRSRLIANTLNKFSAFFLRNEISESGDVIHRAEIREFKLKTKEDIE